MYQMYHFTKVQQTKNQIVVKNEVEFPNVLFSDCGRGCDTE